MDIDIVALSAFIISIISAIGAVINQLHIRKCYLCCAESDCTTPRPPPATPLAKEELEHLLEQLRPLLAQA